MTANSHLIGQFICIAKNRLDLSNGLFYLLIVAFVCIVLGPFLWMLISSISPQIELTATPTHWIPQKPTFAIPGLIYGNWKPLDFRPGWRNLFEG